jgi:hypothetical protein
MWRSNDLLNGCLDFWFGSSAVMQKHSAEWLLFDPNADIRINEL